MIEHELKLRVCCTKMAEEFGITEQKAEEIICGLDIFNIVFDLYENAIEEYFDQLDAENEEEIRNNYDLYKGCINK